MASQRPSGLNLGEVSRPTELVSRLRDEKSVLIVPGDHFGLDGHLRISFGLPHDYLLGALDRIHDLVVELVGEGSGEGILVVPGTLRCRSVDGS